MASALNENATNVRRVGATSDHVHQLTHLAERVVGGPVGSFVATSQCHAQQAGSPHFSSSALRQPLRSGQTGGAVDTGEDQPGEPLMSDPRLSELG